jgi:hypothetical protein
MVKGNSWKSRKSRKSMRRRNTRKRVSRKKGNNTKRRKNKNHMQRKWMHSKNIRQMRGGMDVGGSHGAPVMEKVTLNTNTSGYKYCRLGDQLYYIGAGVYISASNQNYQFYQSIFLPFYGFSGADNTGRLFKYKGEGGNGGMYHGPDDRTILTHLFEMIREDGTRELKGEELLYIKPNSEDALAGYSLINDPDNPCPILIEEGTQRIISDLSDIFGTIINSEDILQLILDYLNLVIGTMYHTSQGDGNLVKEGSHMDHLLWVPTSAIEYFNQRYWGWHVGAQFMMLLQRYNIDNNYKQLRDGVDLTYSLMVQYPEEKYSYKDNFHWIEYIRCGEARFSFDV